MHTYDAYQLACRYAEYTLHLGLRKSSSDSVLLRSREAIVSTDDKAILTKNIEALQLARNLFSYARVFGGFISIFPDWGTLIVTVSLMIRDVGVTKISIAELIF